MSTKKLRKTGRTRQTHDAIAADQRVQGVPEFAPTDERLAHGRVDVQPILSYSEPRDRGRTGHGKNTFPAATVVGYVRRTANVELDERLRRFKDLTAAQKEAATRYERTWIRAQLEPKLTANYAGSSGGGRDWTTAWPDDGKAEAVVEARKAYHKATGVLSGVGDLEVWRVVDAVVLHGIAAYEVGKSRYATSRPQALAHVKAKLETGLGLLAAHYISEGRKARERTRQAAGAVLTAHAAKVLASHPTIESLPTPSPAEGPPGPPDSFRSFVESSEFDEALAVAKARLKVRKDAA